MSLRKSFIEIGWKIDKSGLTTANQETTKMIKKWESALGSIDAYNKRIKQLEAQQGKLTTQVDKTTKAQENSTDQVKKTTDEVERSTKASERQQAATQRHTQAVQKSATHMQSLGNSMQSVGRSASALSLGIGAGFIYSANQASKLQNQYKIITNLATTGGEKSAEAQRNVNKMQNDGAKYSQKYGVAQKQISSGYEELIRRGYTSNQALAAQKTFLQGAIASGDDYTDVVHNSTAAIEAFGLKSNNTAQMTKNTKLAVNQMAYAADLTATDFQGMGYAMTYVGSTAHSADQSLGQTASAIGVLSNAGQEASVAGTGLRKVLNSLASPGPKSGIPALKSIGLAPDDLRDSNGKLKSMSSIFDLLNSKLKGKSRKEKFDFFHTMFGTTGQTSAMILSQNAKQLGSLNEQVKKAQNQKGGGYIANLSGKNMQTFQVQLQRFKQTALNSGIEMSKTFLPAATRILEKVTDLMQSFNKLPKPVRNFAATGALITAAFGPALIIVGKMVSAVGVLKKSLTGLKLTEKFGKSSGRTTKFSSKARIPGSWMLNETGRGKNVSAKAPGPIKTWLGNTRVGKRTSAIKQGAKSLLPTLWSDAKTITKGGASKATGLIGKIPGISRMGSIAKGGLSIAGKVASRVPILDVAMAGTNLIGMNQKNAGKKVGSATGMLAGGAIGSLFGPIGGMAGAAIGQTLGAKFGATIQKVLPKKVQKSIGSAVKSVQRTFSKLLKPFQSVTRSISKAWGSATKGVSKSWNKYVVKPLSGKGGGDAIKGAMKVFKSVLVPTMKVAGVAFKVFGAVAKTAIKAVGHVVSGLIKTVSGTFSLISDLVHGRWKNAWKDAVQIFSGIFGTIKNVLSDILGSIWDGITDLAKNIGDLALHPIQTIKRWLSAGGSSGGNGIGKNVKTMQSIGSGKGAPKQAKPKINVQTGFGKASGGPIKKTQTAMVNEAGTEVAYNPRTGRFRLLGNGPAFAKLFAGEHVINAKDTRKLFGGGLGAGKTLKGYASGTGSLTVASVGLGKASKLTKPSTKGIDSISKAYAKTTKKSNQSIQSFNKTSSKLWSTNAKSAKSATSQMSKTTTKNFTTLKNNATKQLDQTQKNGVTQMKQMHSGINAVAKDMTADFYKIMSKLKGYAHSAMAGAISSLNGGISGINTVLNKFGGGGNVLPAIHYATGTGGPITRHTMAVVNDAKSGPRQETIVKPNGRAFMPQGNDTVVPLEPGDEVLNGQDTQSLQAMGALPHFAKGTTGLADLISKNNSHPDQPMLRTSPAT
ncbi:phage tail tape measure protein [Secundilactobacillus similis]|uniref:phage tail tape measure protein n=1 Tax=Secundilactobacillus similis TaxID=414682 RepID=UPI0006D05597|nr:phage tail tape measure protein [Secundilactobacillus similis]